MANCTSGGYSEARGAYSADGAATTVVRLDYAGPEYLTLDGTPASTLDEVLAAVLKCHPLPGGHLGDVVAKFGQAGLLLMRRERDHGHQDLGPAAFMHCRLSAVPALL